VVFGGDGTMLSAARYLAPLGIPAVGVNLGKFGFLAGCVSSECPRVVEDVLSGKLTPVERTMLSSRIDPGRGRPSDMTALNDVVIAASMPTRMIGVKIFIDTAPVSSFLGDGLIISSATGSTGYNLSSGGPIVTPAEDVTILNPLAPHTLAIRPMVISAAETVRVEVSARRSDVTVTADGQISSVIKHGDSVTVSKAPHSFTLYEAAGWSFYQVAKDKLRWGEEPNYAEDPY